MTDEPSFLDPEKVANSIPGTRLVIDSEAKPITFPDGTVGDPPLTYERMLEEQRKANEIYRNTGAGYQFDAEGAQQLIDILQYEVLIELSNAKSIAEQRLVRVQPPGDEYASIKYVRALNNHGRSYITYLENEMVSVQVMIDSLRAIRDSYSNQEQAAKQTIKRLEEPR